MSKKETLWEGNTLKQFENFPYEVRVRFALDLDAISEGMEPYSKTKQMQGLEHGVIELIKNGKPAYRLVYKICTDKIHVLHAFSKTSNGTDSKHIDTIKARLKSL
jgi:phage-related protein